MTGPACAGKFALFEAADTGDRQARAECLRLCREVCPVTATCLASTLAFERTHGGDWVNFIAGGMLPEARAELLGKRVRYTHKAKKATT